MYTDTTESVIYLAGGCFWGMERLMQSIPGVLDAQSGYANGTGEADANYSAALRFVPREKMEAEGYGYLLDLFSD